jgi:hypothetical protein
MRVLAVPAVTPMMGEEAPRELVVLILHKNTHAPSFARLILHVLLPDHRQEQWTCRIHDGDIGEEPVTIVLLQQLDHTEEEGVLWHRAHGVVGDTGWHGAANPSGVS